MINVCLKFRGVAMKDELIIIFLSIKIERRAQTLSKILPNFKKQLFRIEESVQHYFSVTNKDILYLSENVFRIF